MSEDSNAKLENFKNSLKAKGEQLIVQEFPNIILKLNELIESDVFKNQITEDINISIHIPVPNEPQINALATDKNNQPLLSFNLPQFEGKLLLLPSGAVPANKNIVDLIEIVKPQIRKLLEHSNVIKMWITLMIPKIEDGNNFGVSIQEDILSEVTFIEAEANAFFETIARYFMHRGKLVSKVAKYPQLEDYRRAVKELDEKEYLSLWLILTELRNIYSSMHDIINKNLEKIKIPRSSDGIQNMY